MEHRRKVRDALLLVDVFDDFRHEDGDVLKASFVGHLTRLLRLIEVVREAEIPVIYANDRHDAWHGDRARFLEHVGDWLMLDGLGAAVVALAPQPDDAFFFKEHYSAFRRTALDVLLHALEIERLIVAGMTLEGCVTQTAIDAREHGLKASVVVDACPRIDEEAAVAAGEYLRRVAGVGIDSFDGIDVG